MQTQLDYRAMGALLQWGRGGGAPANATARASADTSAGSFVDAVHPGGLQVGDGRAGGGREGATSTCGEVGRSGAPSLAHPPARTTFVLVNDAFAAGWAAPVGPAAACAALDSPAIRAASSYAPIACEWAGVGEGGGGT